MAFSLKKYRTKLLEIYANLQKKQGDIRHEERIELEGGLKKLQTHILEEDKEGCKASYDALKKIEERLFPRVRYYRWLKIILSNVFFIGMIVVLRQTWFEPYQIPSGSMRPTLKELDRVVVSKHQFGINVPLTPDHFLFDDQELKRGGIITFTGENMDIDDVKTKYFYLFDGYKQYVKRLIGKPGDTLYFYGGKIYGMDKEGNDITSEFRQETFEPLEHIPFLRLEGKMRWLKNTVYIHQYNIPVARIDATPLGTFNGRVLYNQAGQLPVEQYADLFGMHHFGVCRIEKEGDKHFLKIFHHPSLSLNKTLLQKQGMGRLEHNISNLPLDESLLKLIFSNLQTSRFVVKNGLAFPWDNENEALKQTQHRPVLKEIPDGTYEFFDGQAYQIYTQGFSKKLDQTHPLMQFNQERAITLFNIGAEFDLRFGPNSEIPGLLPSRYAYYRDLDLYVMGKKLLDRRDPRLATFIENEKIKAGESKGYKGFIDLGPPLLKDGSLNKDLLSRYGLKVPEGKYLGLGDNHAISADSRDFGFVPASNLRGVLAFVVSPFPKMINQTPYPLWTQPKAIVMSLVIGGWAITHLVSRNRRRFPVSFS